MNAEIIKKRIRAIRRLLNKKKFNCLVLTKPANVTYTTAFLGEDSWALITPRAVYLLTDNRYIEQAQGECLHCKIMQRTNSLSGAVAELLKTQKSVRTIAVETSASLADFKALKEKVKTACNQVSNIIETVRTIKDSTELAAIRKSIRIAKPALTQTLKFIKPGITESELAGMLNFQFRKLAGRTAFDTIVAFGPNASRPHHQSGRRKLKKNDTILIDFGVSSKKYCCDVTRCFVIGKPSPFYKKVYNAVREAQAAAIKMLKPGVKMTLIDAAAKKVIEKYNLPVYEHGTGHGLGLEIHEDPFLNDKTKGKLQAGMVFTIEPGVYIPGKLGIRIEDDVLVTPTGSQILTRSFPTSYAQACLGNVASSR